MQGQFVETEKENAVLSKTEGKVRVAKLTKYVATVDNINGCVISRCDKVITLLFNFIGSEQTEYFNPILHNIPKWSDTLKILQLLLQDF